MSDEKKKDPWLNWLALTTVILALCATMATFKGGGYSTKSVLTQTQASDQWAFYQAKSIKGYLYELHRDKVQLELKAMGASFPPDAAKAYADVIEKSEARLKKYEDEKGEIQKKAKGLEEFRTECQTHSAAFGLAIIFLQIAIVLSSIAALLKKPYIYYAGLIVGVVGVVHFANGFYLFF